MSRATLKLEQGSFVEIQGAPRSLSRGYVVEVADWTSTCEVDILLPGGASVRVTVAQSLLDPMTPTIGELVNALG